MSYVHLQGPGQTHHLLQPLSTRTAQQVARGPWHRNLRHLGGQRQHPRSSATTSFSLGRKLLPRSLSKGWGSSLRLHTGRGFAEMSAADKFPWPPWGWSPENCSADCHWLGAAGASSALGQKQWTLQVTVSATEAADGSSSIQHGIQLVSQGIKHGANVIQNVLGGGAGGAAVGEGQGQISQKSDHHSGP